MAAFVKETKTKIKRTDDFMLLLRVFEIKCRDAPNFTRSYTDLLAATSDALESLPPEKAAFLVGDTWVYLLDF